MARRGCLLAAMVAMLSACTPQALRDTLLEAQARWKAALCLEDPLPYVALSMSQAPMTCDGMLSWGCHGQGWVSISTSVPVNHWLQTLTHEYGHELWSDGDPFREGPKHVPAGQGVMAEDSSSSTYFITLVDIALVCSRRTCACRRPEKP